MARKYTPSCKTVPLESGVEDIFLTLVKSYRFKEAITCIANRANGIPSDKVLSSIIFDILMKRECNKETALKANLYLGDVLTIHPPSDSSRRSFYKAAITGRPNSGLWSVFRHIVDSSFIHHRVFRVEEDESLSEPIPYPNCDILLDFYVRILTESYDYLRSERVFYEGAEKSLVMDMFWPRESSNLSAAKGNPREFLKRINEIYKNSARISQIFAFKNLHKLLNLMVQCILHAEYSVDKVPDSLICNNVCLLDIVKAVFNICDEAFGSLENLKVFMHHLSSKALQFKLCEYKLYELLNSSQPSDREFSPCTLQTIVTAYMLPHKLSTGRKGRPKKQKASALSNKEEEQARKEKAATASSTSKTRGESVLHKYCSTDMPADLYISLSSTPAPDVNEINSLGQTPLHVACLSQSSLCVKLLIDECSSDNSKQRINFGATDDEGLTSLHIAVQKNAIDIARQIMKKGGSKLLNIEDKCGHKPDFYASSKEMKELLKEFTPKEAPQVVVKTPTFSCMDIPTFKIFKEYALFCHCVHFMLTYYFGIHNMGHIRRLMQGENSSLVEVLRHDNKSCPHFAACSENAVCSEDYEYLKVLPDIVSHFVKRISECEQEKSLDLEILPLKMFACSL